MKKLSIEIIMGILLVTPLLATGEDVSQVGRYLTVPNRPIPSQVDLLSQVIHVRFPQSIQTIGDSISYLLQFSGYSLIREEGMSDALKIIITKPLPVIDRCLGPISLRGGLLALVGPAFVLIDDPVNRTVDFKIKPKYINTSIMLTNPLKRISNNGNPIA